MACTVTQAHGLHICRLHVHSVYSHDVDTCCSARCHALRTASAQMYLRREAGTASNLHAREVGWRSSAACHTWCITRYTTCGSFCMTHRTIGSELGAHESRVRVWGGAGIAIRVKGRFRQRSSRARERAAPSCQAFVLVARHTWPDRYCYSLLLLVTLPNVVVKLLVIEGRCARETDVPPPG